MQLYFTGETWGFNIKTRVTCRKRPFYVLNDRLWPHNF